MRASGAGADMRAAGESVETGAAVPTTRDSFAAYSSIDYSYMSGSEDNIPADECEVEGTSLWTTLRFHFITNYKNSKCHHLSHLLLRETNIVVFIKSFFFKRELDITSIEEI